MPPTHPRSLAHVVIHPSPPLWGGNAIFHLLRVRLALPGVQGGGGGGQCHLLATALLGDTPPPSTSPSSLGSWHTLALRARCPPLEGVPSRGSWPCGRAGAWAPSVWREDCGDGPLTATPPPGLSCPPGGAGEGTGGAAESGRRWAEGMQPAVGVAGRSAELGETRFARAEQSAPLPRGGSFDLGAGTGRWGVSNPGHPVPGGSSSIGRGRGRVGTSPAC